MKSWNMVSLPAGDGAGTGALTEMEGTVEGASGSSLLPFHFTSELTVADRRQKREIRQLEQELHKWQVLVDSITGEGQGTDRARWQLCSIEPSLPLPVWSAVY